ncbi:MAG: hypothetical protein A2X23_04350 [Chloroflexi bacterium GWC2_73_18]|nr:MAG: hypothetical protein A2X23_04350 [Chloroflexi bacterium GWC2_73_18]
MPVDTAVELLLVGVLGNFLLVIVLVLTEVRRRRRNRHEGAELLHDLSESEVRRRLAAPAAQVPQTAGPGHSSISAGAGDSGAPALQRPLPTAASHFSEPEPASPGLEASLAVDGPSGPPWAELTDSATGLETADSWESAFELEEERLHRYRRRACVVHFELDGLDALAQRVGHQAGDRLIEAVAAVLRRQSRSADRVARAGPGSFRALLPETDEAEAEALVDRVREGIAAILGTSAIPVRLSVGLASPDLGADLVAASRLAAERLRADRRPTGATAGPQGPDAGQAHGASPESPGLAGRAAGPSAARDTRRPSVREALLELRELHQERLVSDGEYHAKRGQILDRL